MQMIVQQFDYHMNLHYSQTMKSSGGKNVLFDYHMNLHYSQTTYKANHRQAGFDYHMNLHYSQTNKSVGCCC